MATEWQAQGAWRPGFNLQRNHICCSASICDLNHPIQDGIKRERFSLDLVLERLAFEQLHGDISEPSNSPIVNRANVRMIDRGSGLRFTLEALNCGSITAHFFGKKLQCNFALQLLATVTLWMWGEKTGGPLPPGVAGFVSVLE